MRMQWRCEDASINARKNKTEKLEHQHDGGREDRSISIRDARTHWRREDASETRGRIGDARTHQRRENASDTRGHIGDARTHPRREDSSEILGRIGIGKKTNDKKKTQISILTS